MKPIARLAGVSLDCRDPHELATFYRALLDLQVLVESDDLVALKGAGILVTTQRVAEHQEPDWPEVLVPKQIHLELSVDNLDGAEAAAIAIGATKATSQPQPEDWRVLFDPAGHPFCITTLIGDV
jgi:hypothetical protein